jgi:chaperone modulatory protein CbpM
MKETMSTFVEGKIVEEEVEFTFVELCRVSGASEEQLTTWISEGAFEPRGVRPEEWRFSGTALRRVRSAHRLARDFEINPSGIALVLDLLDEIDAMRAQLKRMNQ